MNVRFNGCYPYESAKVKIALRQPCTSGPNWPSVGVCREFPRREKVANSVCYLLILKEVAINAKEEVWGAKAYFLSL